MVRGVKKGCCHFPKKIPGQRTYIQYTVRFTPMDVMFPMTPVGFHFSPCFNGTVLQDVLYVLTHVLGVVGDGVQQTWNQRRQICSFIFQPGKILFNFLSWEQVRKPRKMKDNLTILQGHC